MDHTLAGSLMVLTLKSLIIVETGWYGPPTGSFRCTIRFAGKRFELNARSCVVDKAQSEFKS